MEFEDHRKMRTQTDIQEVTDRLEGLITRLEASLQQRSRREDAYRRMLQETVFVLLATKDAFRSQQLKQLRERIERVLHPVE